MEKPLFAVNVHLVHPECPGIDFVEFYRVHAYHEPDATRIARTVAMAELGRFGMEIVKVDEPRRIA